MCVVCVLLAGRLGRECFIVGSGGALMSSGVVLVHLSSYMSWYNADSEKS